MRRLFTGLLMALAILLAPSVARAAANNPQAGSVGVEATISSPAPTRPATMAVPVSGRSFTSLPITVSGLCPEGVIVKVFSNNIFVGSAVCSNGSYSALVDLFSGTNELLVRNYDNLDQAGPDSNKLIIIYSDPSLQATENRVSLTSSYAKKGADPGATLVWPLIIGGGNGPYAISIDWGDGKPLSLKSTAFSGTVDLDHIYDSAGQYKIIIKATDAKGSTAYLQLIGVANGEAAATATTKAGAGNGTTIVETRYSPIPALIGLLLVIASFWIGRKYELKALRRRLEASAAAEYK